MLGRAPIGMGRREQEGEGRRYFIAELITLDERERDLFVYLGLLFVQEMKVPRGEFICATNKILRIHT